MGVNHLYWMEQAFKQALLAQEHNEVPVGAVIVYKSQILATGFNAPISNADPCAHAEIIAIRKAAKALNNYRLIGCSMYITLMPCIMCLGAIFNSRISHVIYASSYQRYSYAEIFNNLINSEINHGTIVESGYLSSDSTKLLQSFFLNKRIKANE